MSDFRQYRYCPYDRTKLEQIPTRHDGLPFCKDCGFVDYQNPRPCVAVLVFNRDGRVLLARRGLEPAKGEWDFPGGFIKSSETAEQAVVREILEETSLHVRVADYLGSVPDVYGDGGVPTLNLCFVAYVLSGEPSAKSDVSNLSWFSDAELPSGMAFAHQHQIQIWCRSRMRSIR
jgi:NAD+ diphosphatase